jgi:hypothetical protein
MTDEEQEIHDLIRRWVDAVRAGDLDAQRADERLRLTVGLRRDVGYLDGDPRAPLVR